MDDGWTTTGQVAGRKGIKVLVYGNAGMGKSMLCATAPRPAIISTESGLLSLKRGNIERVHGVGTPGITYDIPVKEVKDFATFKKAIAQCVAWFKAGSIETICIDSLSEIAEVCLREALRLNKDGRAAFGDMADDILELCKSLRDLEGPNVYVSTKQGLSSDSGLQGPSLPGKFLDREIPYVFDEIFQACLADDGKGGKQFVLRTRSDFTVYGKDRSGALEMIEYPALYNIIAKISAVA
jgi:hypothetical protein